MKPVYLFFLFLALSCKAPTIVDIAAFNTGDNNNKYFKDIHNLYSNFTGTWQYVNGSQTFRIVLYKTAHSPIGSPTAYTMDVINGSFKIISNAGMANESIVCNSIKYFPQSGQTTTSVITARTQNGTDLFGSIDDTCGSSIIRGTIKLHKISSTQAIVTVEKAVNISGQTFSIPSNVTWVKVN